MISFDLMRYSIIHLLALSLLFISCTPEEEFYLPSQPPGADHYLVVMYKDGDLIRLRGDKVAARNRVWLTVDSTLQLNGKQLELGELGPALEYVITNPDGQEYLPETRDSAVVFLFMDSKFLTPAVDQSVKKILATKIHSLYPEGYFTEGKGDSWTEQPMVRIAPYFGPPEDRGVLAKLPLWSDEEPDLTKLSARNVFDVLVTKNDELLVRGKKTELSALTEMAKTFISNPNKDADLAASPTKAIISLKNDRGTTYEVYLNVYNALKAAYEELWDERAQALYGKPYSDDLPMEERRAIKAAIPMVISEAEPTSFGE